MFAHKLGGQNAHSNVISDYIRGFYRRLSLLFTRSECNSSDLKARRNMILESFENDTGLCWLWIITDRHPNLVFSVCIASPNTKKKIMQTNCVRKGGAVFFGGHGEIIRGGLTHAKSKRSIIKPKIKQSTLLKIMLHTLVLIMQHAYPLVEHIPILFFFY